MMSRFVDITDMQRLAAILLLFLTVILQLFLLILTYHRRRHFLQYSVNCMLFAVAFLFLCLLAAVHGYQAAAQNYMTGELSYLLIIGIILMFAAHAAAATAMEIKKRHISLSVHSVKEAFDNLPCGVCFFNSEGIPVLCNYSMSRLSFALSGRDIQHASEVKEMLENLSERNGVVREGLVYCLPNGTVWHFTEPVIIQGGFTQVSAFEVTELYNKKHELLKDTEQLKKVAKNMRRYANSVQDATREREVLSMKMRIHEEMGSSLTAISRVLIQNLPLSEAEPVIAKWKDTVWTLKKNNEPEIHGDYLAQLRELSSSMNLKIITDGELPALDGANYLLVTALRVCATNAVRHAGATELYAKLQRSEGFAAVEVTNNGTPPVSEISEGGGLTNLRRRIEAVNGTMTVKSDPVFTLTAAVPLTREVYV